MAKGGNYPQSPVAELAVGVLQTAFQRAPVGVGVCDRDGRFVAVNDALAALVAYRPAEMVGRPFLTFVHPQERAASLSAYFTSVVAAASEPRRRAAQAELRCITAAGSVRWLSVSWTITAPDQHGAQYGIVHLSDISARREVERQLAKAQHRFELAFYCAPLGIAVVGRDGRFLQVNPALDALLGYRQDELVNRSFATVLHPGDRASSMAVFEQLLAGELDVHQGVRRFRDSAGRTLQTRRVVAAARDPDGQIEHLLLLIEPISGSPPARERYPEPQIRDPATGLATARHLALHLQLSTGIPRSLVLIDIRRRLQRTTRLSATETDQLIAPLAARLTACCRHTDLIARTGENEFVILADDPDSRTGTALAARVRATLTEPAATDPATHSLDLRVGAATDPTGTRPLEVMLREARAAAQSTPSGWPMTTTAWQPITMTGTARELALEADLADALHNHELTLAYQPIIALADGSMPSLEALSRWQHPTLGPIRPDEFIHIAERSSVIHTLTSWALQTACTDLARWQANYPAAHQLNVAVNISALSFLTPDFPSMVERCLERTGLLPKHLILEITETAAAGQVTGFVENATVLRELGARIALDDFGAGYSSLARIARLPITDLKLDRALTDAGTDPTVIAALLRATVGIARDLGLGLIAEGIETQNQLELLKRCGCPHAQGFLLARPQSPDQITNRLAGH